MDKVFTRRFSAFYFLLFLPIGMQAPYLLLFFKRQGFSDAQLGTLAAVPPLLTVLLPPIWGAVADAFGDRRRTLAFLLVGAAATFPWLVYSDSFGVTLGLLVVFSAFASPPMAIADAISLEHIDRKGGEYGRLRLWGSVGFAVPLLIFGWVLKREVGETAASLYPIFVGYTLFRLVSAGWVWLLPASRADTGRRFDLRAGRAFANPRFLALMVSATVAAGAMSAHYVYFTIYLDDVGIADNLKGYFWVIAVAAETAMMLVIARVIQRIGLKWTFVLGIVGCAVRLTAYSFVLAPEAIACVQLLHALTLTAFMVSGITFVSRMTPPELRASGQSLWLALTHGLGSAAGAKLAGMATAEYGITGMFRVFAIAAAVTALGAIILVREPPEGAGSPPEGAGPPPVGPSGGGGKGATD
jgi:PPP family 3-phenylpropionic acid transporter